MMRCGRVPTGGSERTGSRQHIWHAWALISLLAGIFSSLLDSATTFFIVLLERKAICSKGP
jgi:hypothetical protein